MVGACFAASDIGLGLCCIFIEWVHVLIIGSECCKLIPSGLEPSAVGPVDGILFPHLTALKEPSKSSANIFDKVPDIESLYECLYAEWAALIGCFGIGQIACGFCSYNRRTLYVVDSPRESPKMEDTEEGHFDAEKHRRNPNLNIRGLNLGGGFDCAGRGEEGYDELSKQRFSQKQQACRLGVAYGLPKRQKDNEFDSYDFEAGIVI